MRRETLDVRRDVLRAVLCPRLTSHVSRLISRISRPTSHLLIILLCTVTYAAPPLAPTITWPPAGAILGSNRVDLTWSGGGHDRYEIHIGSFNTPASSNGWDSGEVSVPYPGVTTVETPPLAPQQTYYVFVRLHNSEGWGPWSPPFRHLHVGGELMSDPYLVAGPDGAQRAHTICFNPDRSEYLVAYFDAKVNQRSVISFFRLDAAGTRIGGETTVPDDLEGTGGPWLCYNTARQEYLLTYGGYTTAGGLHAEIRVQRIDAATGGLIGGSIWIDNEQGAALSKVAYSSASDCYLLVWENGGGEGVLPVYAQRLSSTAVPLGGIFHVSVGTYVYAGNPSICYNAVHDEFMVTFQAYYDTEPLTWWDYYAQRVRASDGVLLGPNITIAATPDYDSNGDVTHDALLNRYLVIYDGGPPSPWGQFVTASGALDGPRFPVGNSDFHGGMSAVTWNPLTGEYLATWAHCCTESNFARRLSQAGAYLGEPFRTNGYVKGFGNWDPISALNAHTGESLICWFWQYDDVYVRRYRPYALPPPDTQAPAPVTNLTLTRYANTMGISWTNPSTQDFAGAVVRFKTTGYPSSPTDGTLVLDQGDAPGTSSSIEHDGLARGTYYYAIFAHDEVPNHSPATLAQATILPGDFDGDDDIDQTDFAHLQVCLGGDAVNYPPGCRDADLGDDGDVDGTDLTAFLGCMGGPEQPPGC